MAYVPPIATLRTRAEGILVRSVAGQMRAFLAAICAAQNNGTPIPVSITTQDLITESQRLIDQSESETLAIFVREFMQFVADAGSGGGGGGGGGTWTKGTLAEAKTIATASTNVAVFLTGTYAANDGIAAGVYTWDPTLTDPDDFPRWFLPDDFTTAGGWRRLV